jgi:hypothetical protein
MTAISVKTLFLTAALAGALIGSAAVAAQAADQPSSPPTTRQLYEDCGANDVGRQLSCQSYLAGVADMMRLIGSGIEKGRVSDAARADFAAFGLCQHDYTGTELRQVFITWAAANPGDLDGYRLFGARRAFRQAWRCH